MCRDENKVHEPIRKTDFSNVSDQPIAFPETNFTQIYARKDSCASDWSSPEIKCFNCTFIETESNFGCITRLKD